MLDPQGKRTMQDHHANLTSYEVQLFIDWVLYRWTAEDRCKFAREFPALYNKLVGIEAFQVTRLGHGGDK